MARYNICLTFNDDINERIAPFCQLLKAMNPALDYVQGENSIPHLSLVHFESDLPTADIWAKVEPLLPIMQKVTHKALLLKQHEDRKDLSIFIEEQSELKELKTTLLSALDSLGCTLKYDPKIFHTTLIVLEKDAIVTIPHQEGSIYPMPLMAKAALAESTDNGRVLSIFHQK